MKASARRQDAHALTGEVFREHSSLVVLFLPPRVRKVDMDRLRRGVRDALTQEGTGGARSGLLSWLGVPLTLERHANDVPVKNHGRPDKALHGEEGVAALDAHGLTDQQQPVARPYRAAKADVLQPAEAEEVTLQQM